MSKTNFSSTKTSDLTKKKNNQFINQIFNIIE